MIEELKEDIEQYNVIMDNYKILDSADGKTAYDLAIESLVCADRWNEIALNITKYAKEMECSKTRLYDWAYHKYRCLMTLHEFCRVVYRQCREELREGFVGE